MKIIATDSYRTQLAEDDDGPNVKMPLWHVTTEEAAKEITSGHYRAKSPYATGGSEGVFFTVSPKAAAGLCRSLNRMNSFKNNEEVKRWFVQMGAPAHEVDRQCRGIMQKSISSPDLYLFLLQNLHVTSHGAAKKIPFHEFLFSDMARKFIGKKAVILENMYQGPAIRGVHQNKSFYGASDTEAEAFVPKQYLEHVRKGHQYDDVDSFERDQQE